MRLRLNGRKTALRHFSPRFSRGSQRRWFPVRCDLPRRESHEARRRATAAKRTAARGWRRRASSRSACWPKRATRRARTARVALRAPRRARPSSPAEARSGSARVRLSRRTALSRGCSRVSPEPRRFRAMGTDVVVGGASASEKQAIERLFADWEQGFSRFRRESELNRVNADPAPVMIVSRLFASVLRDALEAAAATDGLVDPDARRRDRGRRLRPRFRIASGRRLPAARASGARAVAVASPVRPPARAAAGNGPRPERRRQVARGRRPRSSCSRATGSSLRAATSRPAAP